MWFKRKNKTVEETFKDYNLKVDSDHNKFELNRARYAEETSQMQIKNPIKSGTNMLDDYYKKMNTPGYWINDPTKVGNMVPTYQGVTGTAQKYSNITKILTQDEIERIKECFILNGIAMPQDIQRMLGIPFYKDERIKNINQEKKPRKRLKI